MHKLFTWTLLLVTSALLTTSALARPGRYELTPTLSYRSAGDFDVDDIQILEDSFETDEGTSLGLTFDIPLNDVLSLELLANRQETELIATGGLFEESAVVADLEIDHYQLGLVAQFGGGQIHPFVVVGLGVARLSVDLPGTIDEDRPAASLGGGVKIYFSEHIGLRIEGRGYYVGLDEDDDSERWEDEDSLSLAEASVGLIFAF